MSDKIVKLEPLFALIDAAGGPKLTDIKTLNFSQKMKISFNIWAFLFSIFYYLYHKLWKKGLVYLFISVVLIILIDIFLPDLSKASSFITSALFASRANIDLYKKYKLNDDSWI